MKLTDYELFKLTYSRIHNWVPKGLTSPPALRDLLEDPSLTQLHKYELGTYLFCETMVGVFKRLNTIRYMTGRSIYKRKNEDKSELIVDWIVYNYQLYVAVFQSVCDISALLVNQVFDLGYPDRQCSDSTVVNNKRVKGTKTGVTLSKIQKMIMEHREGKNLLLHQGKEVIPPLQFTSKSIFDTKALARKSGIAEEDVDAYLMEFLAKGTREQLIKLMEDECELLETEVGHLFDEILLEFKRMLSSYTNP